MTNFSIFTDAQLAAAEARHAVDFEEAAEKGFLATAEASHVMMIAIRGEIARRAEADALKALVEAA